MKKLSRETFFGQLLETEYGKQYLDIVSECKRTRVLVPGLGYEMHHIQPKALGGSNRDTNIVKLSIYEHCKCHALIARALPCYETLQPLVMMSRKQIKNVQDLDRITLEEVYKWSELREQALHRPKPEETIKRSKKSLQGRKLSREHVQKRTTKRIGTVTITDGKVTKYIQPSELKKWETKGWKKGVGSTRKEKLSSSHRGRSGKNSTSFGRKCIHRNGKELKVQPKDLDKYLKEGWKIGRDPSFSKNRDYTKNTNKGKVRIHKDGTGKLIILDHLQLYLDRGWKQGIVKRSRVK